MIATPVLAYGLAFWGLGQGNFWGHNAIIRLAPFMQHCALPELPGRSAIGRRPMSHDFVEAALMRRAGWEVHLAEDLGGSYEETPPTVIEHLKRDRRWCQGNLQHWPLALARGFRPVTRFHFLHGIFSFLASPLLLLGLALGFLKNLTAAPVTEGLFADAARVEIALLLFSFTSLLLLLPKVLALILAWRHGRAAEFGGALGGGRLERERPEPLAHLVLDVPCALDLRRDACELQLRAVTATLELAESCRLFDEGSSNGTWA